MKGGQEALREGQVRRTVVALLPAACCGIHRHVLRSGKA